MAADSATQTTFYVPAINISLARSSTKVIQSITLYKNGKQFDKVEKAIQAGESHREEFKQPISIVPSSDHFRASVICSSHWRKRITMNTDINLRDIQSLRNGGSMRLYKRIRNIDIVVFLHQQALSAVTTGTIQDCPRFRLLIIGHSGVGKTSLILKVFGIRITRPTKNISAEPEVEREFISPTNERFVVHDSLGFESGDVQIVQGFIAKRNKTPELKDRLHAVWLCLEIPHSGVLVLDTGVRNFLQRRKEILGDVPLVVVFTKVDMLNVQLEIKLPKDDTLENFKSKFMDEHCIKPLREAAGDDVRHVTVSTLDSCSSSLSELLNATDEIMAYYDVGKAPRTMARIAQRISIKGKIDLSISIGKQKFWSMLLKSAAFRGYTLNECLKVIRTDITRVWNFNDPDECLMDDRITSYLIRTDNLNLEGITDAAVTSSEALSSPGLLYSRLAELQVPKLPALPPILRAAPPPTIMYERYQEAQKDVKLLMAYIIDLICVMQIIFLSISGDRVTPDAVAFALQAYEEPRMRVHRCIADFHTGVALPGGHDYVLEMIEKLIWQFSILDSEIEELRQRMRQVVLRCVPLLPY